MRAPPPPPPEERPQTLEAPDMSPPSFDIVRVAPDGGAVFAGRAEPGAEVSVVDSDEVLGSAVADARGEWVVLPSGPLPPGTRELGVVARTSSGIESRSESVVVLMVPEPPGGAAADAGEAAVSGPLAVLVARGDEGVSRLIQGGEPAAGIDAPEGLSLDAITYDSGGSFDLAGRALPGSAVTAYVGERAIGTAWVTNEGGWRIAPEETVDPGLYTLRVVEVGESGALVSRLETPFTVADVSRTAVAEGLVVVQFGNSLWRIARRIYGAGARYTLIFDGNRDQIRDPALIFPGQILIVPKAAAG
jgi:nucleoid-associated protein YgaU